MLTDITCPVELIALEQAAFPQGRRQGYLRLRNEGDAPLLTIDGELTLLDAQGKAVGRRAVHLKPESAPPGEAFDCRLPLDGYPDFAQAHLLAEIVAFANGDVWHIDRARLMDTTPPELPQGAQRVALVAVAGHDALCYPQRRGSVWICVCGRFNTRRRHACRRCGRDRDQALSRYTPEQVQAAYAHFVALEQESDKKRLAQRAKQDAQKQEKARKAARHAQRAALWRRRLIVSAAALVLLALLGWGLMRLFTHAPYHGDGTTITLTPSPSVDYLQPI